jgi:hypothetical protein
MNKTFMLLALCVIILALASCAAQLSPSLTPTNPTLPQTPPSTLSPTPTNLTPTNLTPTNPTPTILQSPPTVSEPVSTDAVNTAEPNEQGVGNPFISSVEFCQGVQWIIYKKFIILPPDFQNLS